MSDHIHLPPEIIRAILLRLPAKALGRFKSVSKTWCSLICDPQFSKTHLHLNNHHKPSKLILISYTLSLCSLNINEIGPSFSSDNMSAPGNELSFGPLSIRWDQILGSCNGLVLAVDEDVKKYLINPTTRELFELPLCPFLPFGAECFLYGFCYDSLADDYKVISICFWDTDHYEHVHTPDCTDMFVNIYSLSNNSWRKLGDFSYDVADYNPMGGVLVNGNLHWLIITRPTFSLTIIAFSLAKEEMTEIELPDSVDYNEHLCRELVVINGKLGFWYKDIGTGLWVMEEYGVGKCWTKVFIHGDEIDHVQPVCSVDDINPSDEGGSVIYNVDERLGRNVENVIDYGYCSMTYVDSLESPKCNRTL